MSTLTLGYQADTTISKAEIARIQLTEAIALFLAGKFLCATTLAGAAEAVLAGLLSQRGGTSVVEASTVAIRNIREHTEHAAMGEKKASDIYNAWNDVRNQFKHHGKGDDNSITINLFDESYWMIRRGLENARRLAIPINNDSDFENWVIVNINI
jgi:hypothetical protein